MVGTVALLVVTRKGVYASPDSAFYVGTARNLLHGHGLTAPPGSPPLSHFPPLFPLVLAGVGWLTGLDPLDGAGVVNPLLLGATAFLVAVAVRRRSGSVALGVAASAAVVVGVDLLVYYGSALSEPLFVVVVLGAMLCLAAAVDDGNRWWWWVAAAVLTAGACLTRYVGVGLVAAEMVILVLVGGRRRVATALAFAAASLAPLVVWLVRAGRGNRPIVVHFFDVHYWADGWSSLSRWVLPPFVPGLVRGLVTAVVVVALVGLAVVVRRPPPPSRPLRPPAPPPPPPSPPPPPAGRDRDVLGLLLPTFTLAYLAVLLADRIVLDATGRLDLRFLAVLHVVAVVGLLPWLHRNLRGRARPVVAATGLALLALHGIEAITWAADGLTDTGVARRGLTAAAWDHSTVLAAIAALPPDVAVYSNAPEAIFLLIGRATSPLPAHTDYLSDRRRPEFAAELAATAARLGTGGAVVVWFRPYAYRQRFLATAADFDVEPVVEDAVGTLSRGAGR
ncbi:MAG: hypothetical protein QOG43_1565 [Actinomycetota bacterium]|nr:hypothetical protein [Actinomycetota bacterium]